MISDSYVRKWGSEVLTTTTVTSPVFCVIMLRSLNLEERIVWISELLGVTTQFLSIIGLSITIHDASSSEIYA
jgi:hypothetical protein